MKSFFYTIFVLYTALSCISTEYNKNTLTEINQRLLIGEWYPQDEYCIEYHLDSEPQAMTSGEFEFLLKFNLNTYRFLDDDICENYLGFYEYGDPENGYNLSYPNGILFNKRPSLYDGPKGPRWLDNIIRSYGNRSKYRVNGDSLHIYEPGLKKWIDQRMVFHTKDSLTLFSRNDSVSETYIRNTIKVNKKRYIDQIIVKYPETSYSDYTLFSIQRSGEYLSISSQDKFYTGRLEEGAFEQIEDMFKKANQVTPLESYYYSNRPQGDGYGPDITFIMNGQMKTLESVFEYVPITERTFYHAFFSTLFMPDYVHIKPNYNYPQHLPVDIQNQLWGFWKFVNSDSSEIGLFSTECLYLMTQMLESKHSIQEFDPTYKLMDYDYRSGKYTLRAETDGQYYRYLSNGVSVTLDIGFNFIKEYELEKRLLPI